MTPILPENRARYPADWALRSRFVRHYRARNRCEWCGARNGDRDYTPHKTDAERTGAGGKLCDCCRHHWHAEGSYALKQRWL